MTKTKLLSIAVIGLLLLNIAMVAFLYFSKGTKRPGSKGDMQKGGLEMQKEGPRNLIIERLHFTDAQTVQYDSLISVHKKSIANLDDSIRLAKNELYHSLAENNSGDRDNLIAKLGLLQRKIELTHYNHFADIRKICKPAQYDDYTSLTNDLAEFFTVQPSTTRPENGRPPKGEGRPQIESQGGAPPPPPPPGK